MPKYLQNAGPISSCINLGVIGTNYRYDYKKDRKFSHSNLEEAADWDS